MHWKKGSSTIIEFFEKIFLYAYEYNLLYACIIGTAPSSEGLDEIFDYVSHTSALEESPEEPSD